MNDLGQIAAWLRQSSKVVAFTGAGISTESGIPDFRSPGGVWSQTQPVYFESFLASAEARHEYWRQKSITHQEFLQASPNAGHQVLAHWQQVGLLSALITQNIDGLHQIAGNRDVIELHGTAREVMCLDCGARFDADPMVRRFLEEDAVPPCPRCGTGLLKHATISFGQSLDADVLRRASRLSTEAELMLAMGSSLVVEPAASMPRLAKQQGARLVIINRDPTPQDNLADLVIHEPIGQTLTAIDQQLESDTDSS